MKRSRNPIARNAWKVNRKKVIPAKKGKGAIYKRDKKVVIYA